MTFFVSRFTFIYLRCLLLEMLFDTLIVLEVLRSYSPHYVFFLSRALSGFYGRGERTKTSCCPLTGVEYISCAGKSQQERRAIGHDRRGKGDL